MQDEQKIKALADYLEIKEDEAESLIDDGDYLVYTDEEADVAVEEYIKGTLWAFNASFLAGETGLPEEAFSQLSKLCEDSNDAILAMVEQTCGIDGFVYSAVSADGRGHFLSSYDGQELELDNNLYAYRVN